ncbi:MAG: hypothetical protein OEY58_22320 [Gammaproteobacteria bacterium]|nr:hypothetical protein [Gammaproteobacteria bacterium]
MAKRKADIPYDEEVGREICFAVMDGKNPEDVCGKDGIPEWRVVKGWMLDAPEDFGIKLELAQAIGIKNEIGRLRKLIAEVRSTMILPGAKGDDGEDRGAMNPQELKMTLDNMIHELKHLASMERKSVRHEVTGKNGAEINFTVLTTVAGTKV